jgi:hypothetical protein
MNQKCPSDICAMLGEISSRLPLFHSSNKALKSGITLESKKNAHLQSHQGATFIRLNELGRVSIFTSKKVWKFLKKIS